MHRFLPRRGAGCRYGILLLFVGCFLGFLGRVDDGIFAGVGDGGGNVNERHEADDDYGDIVQYAHGDEVAEEGVGVADGREGGDGNKQGVGNDDNEAELGGAKLDVGETEFAFEVGVDAHVDGQDKVDGKSQEGELEVEEGGEAGTDEHEALVDAVDSVVDIVAVDGTLAVADTCKGAVERVAEPVDDQTGRAEPEPLYAPAGESEADGHHEGAECAHGGEHVGGDPSGQPFGYPYQGFLFQTVDE